MLEIKLTGAEAQAYLDKENAKDALIEKLEIQLAELQLAVIPIPMSARVQHDTDVIKGLDPKRPSFVQKTLDLFTSKEKESPFKHVSEYKNEKNLSGEIGRVIYNDDRARVDGYIVGTYTQGDLAIIEARMEKNPTNQDRSLKSIAGALGRKPSSVRDKLKQLNIKVSKGMCYYKD